MIVLTRFAAVLSLCAASSAAAQETQPLSAIDWLSNSVAPEAAATRDIVADEPPVANDARAPEVRVTPLDSPSPDRVGLLSSATTGLPATLWARSDNDTLVMLVQAESLPGLPALQELMVMLLLAEADPPMGAGPDGTLFLARVDKLLDMGQLPRAQALLELAEPETPALFRRWFDVALLTGTEDDACAVMQDRPAIAPTFPARIFCLARSGDWPAAALTLNTHRVLGDVTEAEEALLSRFLDPELYEGEDLLPPPARVSPLVFRLREAIGEGLGTAPLPLAFAHADLRDTAGWKARLEAAERLARAGALPATVLQDLYTSRRPSASGGVWDRVTAFQTFDVAIQARDAAAVSRSLPAAWAAMRTIRAEVPFARLYAQDLLDLDLDGAGRDIALTLGFLSPAYETVARDAPDADPFLAALARGVPQEARARGDMARAIQAAFDTAEPSPVLAGLLRDGKMGEALLRTIATLNAGAVGDTGAVAEGLAVLRALALEDVARRTALQLMLLDRQG